MDFSYFLSASKNHILDLDSLHKQYFSPNLINFALVYKLNIKNFFLLDSNCLYRAAAIQSIMVKVPDYFFAKALQNQKIELNSIQIKNLYPSSSSH